MSLESEGKDSCRESIVSRSVIAAVNSPESGARSDHAIYWIE